MTSATGSVEREIRACYAGWGRSYYDDYYGPAAAYPPVHRDIVRGLLREHGARTLLDVGCGPASMLRDLLDLEIDPYGFDLTDGMVTEARRVLAERGLPAERIWSGSASDASAFRDPAGAAPALFDAALCIGVLPHVPEADEPQVLANLHGAVRPGGLVVIEARNTLFSLFTLNRYTHDLLARDLIDVEGLRARGADSTLLEPALAALAEILRMDLPPRRVGGDGEGPGYDEVLSRTHNPLVLPGQLAAAGFENVRVLFYHYHGLPPMFEDLDPAAFRAASLERERPGDWRGHFMASAFMVAGCRA